jgi:hypothetical protein
MMMMIMMCYTLVECSQHVQQGEAFRRGVGVERELEKGVERKGRVRGTGVLAYSC